MEVVEDAKADIQDKLREIRDLLATSERLKGEDKAKQVAVARARMAAVLMASSGIPHGFAYTSEQKPSLFWDGVWVPRVDVQRIEGPDSTMIVCGMR